MKPIIVWSRRWWNRLWEVAGMSALVALAACAAPRPVPAPVPPTPAPIVADDPAWPGECAAIWRAELGRDIDPAGLEGCIHQRRAGRSVEDVTADVRSSDEWKAKHPPLPPRPSDPELHHVLANFCNLTDSKGRVVFTAMTAGLPAEDRAEWLRLQVAAGSTHVAVSPRGGYPGSPIPAFDLYGQPDAFAAIVREIMATPGANGKALTPILILDDGVVGFRDRVQRFWPGIRSALGDDADRVLVVPGWELVKASEVTSAEYSFALEYLHAQGWPHIWAHLSPGRAAASSNPVEPDDPWQGAEADMWKTHGGQYVEGLLYQSEALRPNDDTCDPADDGCWLNRWEDVVPRLGTGMNGWRVMYLTFFEGPAYYYYRGQADTAFALRVSRRALALCQRYGVTCGLGNGVVPQ